MIRSLLAMLLMLSAVVPAAARGGAPTAPYPLHMVRSHPHADLVYPSAAGRFLVYTERGRQGFSVVRVPLDAPDGEGLVLRADWLHGAIRRGVALADGSIGYVANNLGPISAWQRRADSDLHRLIANGGSFVGGLTPIHLAAAADGSLWALDSYLNRERRSRFLDTFANANVHMELLGQNWRVYWSDADHWKVGYQATETGVRNKFDHPALFLFRRGAPMTMIRNAFDPAISADGRRVVFVRELHGNFDLWMQRLDDGMLVRLTRNRYGDFEPAISPDGRRIAFVSNRASRGDVRRTAIFVLDLADGTITQVTSSRRATDGGPTWRDGRTILFHSNRDPRRPQRGTVDRWSLWEVTL
ncbi:MAG: hypothetical protein D6682_03750 [Zetaproteobacteria bacterium]|nr:MAG: hypothetical protein D6682_03750 [Zetaproteobacteria bacterium]